jgi:hypothetical protein
MASALRDAKRIQRRPQERIRTRPARQRLYPRSSSTPKAIDIIPANQIRRILICRNSGAFVACDVTVAEAGWKSGRHGHLVAGTRWCLDTEGAIALRCDGDLRREVTLA